MLDHLRFEILDDRREAPLQRVALVGVEADFLEAVGEMTERVQHGGFLRMHGGHGLGEPPPPQPELQQADQSHPGNNRERGERKIRDVEQAERQQADALRRADKQRKALREVIGLLNNGRVDLATADVLERPQFRIADLLEHPRPQVRQAPLQQPVGFPQRNPIGHIEDRERDDVHNQQLNADGLSEHGRLGSSIDQADEQDIAEAGDAGHQHAAAERIERSDGE